MAHKELRCSASDLGRPAPSCSNRLLCVFAPQGDVLITKCTYNTEDRSKATVVSSTFDHILPPCLSPRAAAALFLPTPQGGFGILEEMCVNYVHYYPQTRLELCKTHVDMEHLQRFFSAMSR